MTTDWTFGTDADRDDPLTRLRIAVTSPYADWCYITAFDRDSPVRPTDAEAAMLASFLREYIERWYSDSYKVTLAQRLLDVDGAANGVTFHKYGEGDWAYRRRSWRYGPTFVPAKPDRPLTLTQVMDHIHTIAGDEPMQHWLEWKAAYPEVFPA